MDTLITILYWISTGLMVPVVIVLLIMLIRSLLMLGGMYGIYSGRLKFNKQIDSVTERCRDKHATDRIIIDDTMFKNNPPFKRAVRKMIGSRWEKVHGEKVVLDYETDAEKRMTSTRLLLRVGPMLGLMGTLIPMGPALVSLGAGDISSMASNMQVAFATTVVGIFIGAIGFLCHQVQNRWHIEDLNNLEYLLNVMNEDHRMSNGNYEEEGVFDVEKTTV